VRVFSISSTKPWSHFAQVVWRSALWPTGENIRFPPKAALALGIAFNELATNAVKYGALSNAAGSILVDWKIEPGLEGNRLILNWQEKDGPPLTPPSHRGFGSRMIEQGLAHELEARVHLDYRADGVVCTMNIPAPRGTSDALIGRASGRAQTGGTRWTLESPWGQMPSVTPARQSIAP